MAHIPEFKARTFSTPWFSFFGQWFAFLIVIVLIVPTVVVISLLFSTRTVIAVIGLITWLPALGFILIWLHKQGFIRLMLSVPVLVIASIVMAFSWANL